MTIMMTGLAEATDPGPLRPTEVLSFKTMRPTVLLRLLPWALGGLLVRAATAPDPILTTFHHENVLGTSFELKVHSVDAATASRAEAVSLAEIDRLARIFSGYSPESEFSRWQRTRSRRVPISSELLAVLVASERWQRESQGAFNPGVERLTRLWKTAAAADRVPDTSDLALVVRDLAKSAWRIDATAGTAEHLSDTPLSLNAIAKGYIIEQASAAASRTPGVEGVLLEIGGDLRVRGRFPHRVALTDPRNDAENAPPLTALSVVDQGLATSGGYRRGVRVRGQSFSHILDPRTGQPVQEVAGVTVLAPDAMTADALSTTLSVLGPVDGLRLVEANPGIACLMVMSDGRQVRSSRWPATSWTPVLLADETAPKASAPAKSSPLELRVDFEIRRAEGGRYQRPYVAAWIEDKDGFPVRTLLLWILKSEKGQRWIPDLRRWHRGDQVRRLAEDKDLTATLSGATRNPGKYSVVWDGRDDHGEMLPSGNYTFYLEAAREHGTYQLMKHPFAVGGDPFKVDLKGNEEIQGASLEYRRSTSGN